MPKKNKNQYNLSAKLDQKHASRVVTIGLDYFVPEDEMHANVSLRKDATDPALLLKLFRGIEKSMRAISPEYEEDFTILEGIAKQYLLDGETNGFRQSENDSEQPRGCRCR